jgi:hypothetical protein
MIIYAVLSIPNSLDDLLAFCLGAYNSNQIAFFKDDGGVFQPFEVLSLEDGPQE